MRPARFPLWLAAVALAGSASGAAAQATSAPAPAQPAAPRITEQIEVVATKVPEAAAEVPAAIEVFSGDELRARGVTDLRSALAFATGVDVAPGGDGGPAASVPEFMGLKEFDAFLLVVDEVPWGGAFNPALGSVSLEDVERIEVMRGPAPVSYGATSFVGVIHVVHKQGGQHERSASMRAGSYASGGASLSTDVPLGRWRSRLTVDVERRGFSDDRTSFRKGHALWRGSKALATGRTWFNVDVSVLDQDPASPHPREGRGLSAAVPLDANHNPAGAFLDERRATLAGGYARRIRFGEWTTTASVSRASQDLFRGFLLRIRDEPGNARGVRETIDLTDLYVDTHVAWTPARNLQVVTGGDYLHGTGEAQGAAFEYGVALDGRQVSPVSAPADLDRRIDDRRDFIGTYVMAEWRPHARLRLDAGIRLNVTREERGGGERERVEETDAAETHVRPSASLGAIYTAWRRSRDAVRLFVNYRDTFKPAAFDFGIGEAEREDGLLDPETARSVEGGVRTAWMNGRLGLDASGFSMHFENLVVAQAVDGLPALANAGTERFRGIETSASFDIARGVTARANYSFHDARFLDYLTEFDGVSTQLSGKRLEMSPRHLAALGVVWAPARGVIGAVEWRHAGDRYLNKRNTALAGAFDTLNASIGYRLARGEIRVDARNLTDRRDPVAESELGDAQYYRLPARRVDIGYSVRF